MQWEQLLQPRPSRDFDVCRIPSPRSVTIAATQSLLAREERGTSNAVFVMFFAFFKVIDVVMGNRVSADAELERLDIPEMGALAYPDFVLGPGTPMHGMSASSTPASSAQPALNPAKSTT